MKKYIGKNIKTKALNILMIMACIGSSTANASTWRDPATFSINPWDRDKELLGNIAYLLGISYTDPGVLTTTKTDNSTYEQIQAIGTGTIAGIQGAGTGNTLTSIAKTLGTTSEGSTISKTLNTIKRTTDKTAKSIANSTNKGGSTSGNPKGPVKNSTSVAKSKPKTSGKK
jgi:hypothetical protein